MSCQQAQAPVEDEAVLEKDLLDLLNTVSRGMELMMKLTKKCNTSDDTKPFTTKDNTTVCLRFVRPDEPGRRTSFTLADYTVFSVSNTLDAPNEKGWRRLPIKDVTWFEPHKPDNTKCFFSMPNDITMERAEELFFQVVSSLSGCDFGKFGINFAFTARKKHPHFFNYDSSKHKGEFLKDRLLTLTSKTEGKIIPVTCILPARSFTSSEIDKCCKETKFSISKYQQFVSKSCEEIIECAKTVLTEKVYYTNCLFLEEMMGKSVPSNLVETLDKIDPRVGWYVLNNLGTVSFAPFVGSIDKFKKTSWLTFLRSVQMGIARSKHYECELIKEEPKRLKPLPKNDLKHRVLKSSTSKCDEKQNCLLCPTSKKTPEGRRSITFLPCKHKCMCKSCYKEYLLRYGLEPLCLYCRTCIKSIK